MLLLQQNKNGTSFLYIKEQESAKHYNKVLRLSILMKSILLLAIFIMIAEQTPSAIH